MTLSEEPGTVIKTAPKRFQTLIVATAMVSSCSPSILASLECHHPQSMRIQNEDTFVILDKNFSAELTNQFCEDIQKLAVLVTNSDQL